MPYCRTCGAAVADDARFCPSCGAATGVSDSEPQAGAAPVAGAPAPGVPTAPVLASLGRRFVAHLVDLVVVFIAFWTIGSRIAAETGGLTESGFELSGAPAMQAMGLTALVAIAYFTLFEGFWRGRTLGKWLVGIRVVAEDGSDCSAGQALGRNVLRLIDALFVYLVGLVAALMSDRKQRIGDRIAGTVVVRSAKAKEAGRTR